MGPFLLYRLTGSAHRIRRLRYGKSSAQVAIAWLAQRGIIVIPKSVTAARIAQNREVGFELSAEDMAAVSALNKDFRNGEPSYHTHSLCLSLHPLSLALCLSLSDRLTPPAGWGGPKVEREGGLQPRDLLHPLYPFKPDVPF